MRSPRFVCPDNERLLTTFSGLPVALTVRTVGRIADGANNVRASGNNLACVILESDRPLAAIKFGECLKNVPLVVIAPSLGPFRELTTQLDLLRTLDVRVLLGCESAQNVVALRILSSVGIRTCADFTTGDTDWEALVDLATWAVLGPVPHAPIDPFAFIASNYDPACPVPWGRVLFDDPRHYLHVDDEGRVALSRRELRLGRFIAANPSEIGAADEFAPIRERCESWRRYFVDDHSCASCAGWKACFGRFASTSAFPACSEFFEEIVDLARRHAAARAAREGPSSWQP